MKSSKKKMVQKEQGCPLGNSECPVKDCQGSKGWLLGLSLVSREAGPGHPGVLLFRDTKMQEFGSPKISVLMTRCLISLI